MRALRVEARSACVFVEARAVLDSVPRMIAVTAPYFPRALMKSRSIASRSGCKQTTQNAWPFGRGSTAAQWTFFPKNFATSSRGERSEGDPRIRRGQPALVFGCGARTEGGPSPRFCSALAADWAGRWDL